ncbi:hypothetical protein, partial [Staphylococcus aureus]
MSIVSGATRVTVTADPFSMSFNDSAGNTLLAEVANTGQQPVTQAAAVLKGATAANNTLYAPISFLVGTITDSQWPGFI